jgi:hypothetical protein
LKENHKEEILDTIRTRTPANGLLKQACHHQVAIKNMNRVEGISVQKTEKGFLAILTVFMMKTTRAKILSIVLAEAAGHRKDTTTIKICD